MQWARRVCVHVHAAMLMVIVLQFAVITDTYNAADVVLTSSVGESVELPSALGQAALDDFVSLQWQFNNSMIIRYSNGVKKVNIYEQFRGRLELSSEFSVTVRNVTVQDSGEYQRTGARKDGEQTPKHTISLHVYEPIRSVTIQPNITWVPENLTCEVSVMCSSSVDQSVSYTWRKGDQTVRSRQLHFSLSQQEGDVNITCTAANAVSEKNTTHTVRCDPTKSPGVALHLYVGATAGAAVICVIVGVLLFCCRCRHSGSPGAEPGMKEPTCFTVNRRRRRQRPQTQSNCISLYETVMDASKQPVGKLPKPETVYVEVTLNHCSEAPPRLFQNVL
ncbi:natural killer cell receptor 2B4-like [Arapaima gigas]